MDFLKTSSIENFVDKIPNKSKVVFDWDNTLKVTSADRKHIESGLSKGSLNILVKDKQCSLYIISAIRPTRMNLDTLLIEVDKLGLKRYFCPECKKENYLQEMCSHNIKPDIVSNKYTYVCWGNIVICAYDKAEVFLELLKKEDDKCNVNKEVREVNDMDDGTLNVEKKCHDKVYFFDDEDVNIENFCQLVRNSECILVQR